MNESIRPNGSRRAHQAMLARQRRRRRKRRLARVRRIRRLRALRSLRFWVRTACAGVVMLLLVFWAKFAFVYHIPEYAEQGPLVHAEWYITVKPWWFGPPVFDLASYAPNADDQGLTHPYAYLLNQLGKYAAILEAPQPVWVQTQP